MAEQEPRYSTLRDYVALLRRQKLVVLAVALVFGGAALALSASQESTYEAESALQFNDIAREIALLGEAELPADTNPLVRAAIEAEEATSLETAQRVKRRLKTEISADRLKSAIETMVGSQTIFVQITASWDDPEFAARLANTYAEVLANGENRDLERQLSTTIDDLRPQAQGPLLDDEAQLDLARFNARNTLSQVQSLRNQVRDDIIVPAEVARRAEVPDGAASPRTTRNTVLGLIVGLALGLLAAFIRDTLDRRIRGTKDAHDAFGLPVLGRVGKSALGSTGVARGSGGLSLTNPADVESFRILRTNIASLDSSSAPRSVLVTSGLPQEGKSTVACGLAAASAAAGQQTLLVDGDLRRPVLANRLGLPRRPGLADYLAGRAEPKDILHTVPIGARARSGDGDGGATHTLVCIPAGDSQGEPAELLASDRCRDFLSKVSRAYDLVVIDSSPLLSSADPLELVPHVESALICVRLTTSTRDGAKAVREAVRLLPERPTGLVVTDAGAGDDYYGYYGY